MHEHSKVYHVYLCDVTATITMRNMHWRKAVRTLSLICYIVGCCVVGKIVDSVVIIFLVRRTSWNRAYQDQATCKEDKV
jgi:hypothetical protein